jgi:hypothetical protein
MPAGAERLKTKTRSRVPACRRLTRPKRDLAAAAAGRVVKFESQMPFYDNGTLPNIIDATSVKTIIFSSSSSLFWCQDSRGKNKGVKINPKLSLRRRK